MAAITSIMNRFTGMALTVGITGIGALALVGADVPGVMTAVGNAPAVGILAKFAVGFPLTYHYLGGLRHTVWDKMPENNINNESVLQSSYLLLGSATAISVALAFVKI
jgi:succinate dehydrogenase (ubiquinone) cytochrome b560 subunit